MSTEFIENTPGVGEKASVRAPGSYKLSDEVLASLSVCSKVDCLPMVQPVPLLSPNLVISWFFKIETGFYPRRYSTTVLAAMCLSQVVCQNISMDQASFWHGGFCQHILHCFISRVSMRIRVLLSGTLP